MSRPRDARIEVLSSETLLDGRIFDILEERIRLPSGLEQQLQMVEHHGAVAIAALTDEGRMLLVRQYRHSTGQWMAEIPAGRLESDEEPIEAAQRELEEETGRRAGSWKKLRTFYPAPGFCSELMHLYLAQELEELEVSRPADADEEIEVISMTPDEIVTSEHIIDAKTLIAAMDVLRG